MWSTTYIVLAEFLAKLKTKIKYSVNCLELSFRYHAVVVKIFIRV